MRFSTLLTAVAFGLAASLPGLASAKTLTVYTYDAFTSDWGPGPKIKEAFEAECACTLEYVALDSSIGVLSRLRLEGESTKADVVLGLDLNIMAEARKSGLLAQHGVTPKDLALPVAWDDEVFLPFDYGYFAFVYNSEKLPTPPASLRELVEGQDELSVIYQDPRTSTPGQGLMLWMRSVYGDDVSQAWSQLAQKTVTVTKGWSEAYGLFLDGEAPLVLSYTTSPAYHMTVDKEDRYQAAAFAEGHYMQVEVAAMLKSARKAVARQARRSGSVSGVLRGRKSASQRSLRSEPVRRSVLEIRSVSESRSMRGARRASLRAACSASSRPRPAQRGTRTRRMYPFSCTCS